MIQSFPHTDVSFQFRLCLWHIEVLFNSLLMRICNEKSFSQNVLYDNEVLGKYSSEVTFLFWLEVFIKECSSVPSRPEKSHKTVPKSAECYKCTLCGQNFSRFSTICISAIKPFQWMIFCMDFKLTLWAKHTKFQVNMY